jgi:tetratricopeptide (TPR) repeat protein
MGLAGLLLGCRFFRTSRDANTVLSICTANGVLLSFFGMIQRLTWHGKIFWTFQINLGSPFGPFINRNNGAGFLLMSLACCVGLISILMATRKSAGPLPIISKEMPFWRQFYWYAMDFIAELTAPKVAALVSFVVIASGIVATLSRGGGLAMLVGGIGTLLVYGMARRPKNIAFLLVPVVFLVIGLTGWIGFSDQLMKRWESVDMVNISQMDGRVQNWIDTWPATSEMGWLGAGLGSYRQVHRLYNTGHERTLFEYAENQFFQALVELGWPGLLLFVGAWLMAIYYAGFLLFRGRSALSVGLGTFGIYLLISQGVAASFDFGLYAGANMLQMAVLVGVLSYHAHALGGRLKKKNWLQAEVSNRWVQLISLGLFAGLTLVSIDYYRQVQIDRVTELPVGNFNFVELGLAPTEEKIEQLETLVKKSPRIEGLNYLAELWIHRARLQFMESIMEQDDYKNRIALLTDKEIETLDERVWRMTSLQRIQENWFYLKREVSQYQAGRFLNSPFIRDNLSVAENYLAYSRLNAPLQPVVHLRLGQIAGAMGDNRDGRGDVEIESAITLAPSNPNYRLIAGIYHLQNGHFQQAAPHLRKYLELIPRQFDPVVRLLKGESDHRVQRVSLEMINESVLPDDPRMLFDFARLHCGSDEVTKQLALERADELLGEVLPSRLNEVLLRAEIRLAKGETDLAIEAMLAALKSNPMDDKTQLRVARLMFQEKDYFRALQQARKLLRFDSHNAAYNELIRDIEYSLEKLKELEQNENQ